jgi:hypothetical protein
MTGSPKACLFCGRTGQKLTIEHVYPRWLHRALNIQGDITFTTHGELKRSAAELDVKVREVCSDCNNGWLHDLERAFRAVMIAPMNGYGPLHMPAPVQLVVALWATKTWLLIERSMEYMRGKQPVYVRPDVFRWMREQSEPPPAMQVWIGAIDRESAKAAGTVSFVVTQWVGVEDPPAGIAGIFTIGCVLFLVYATVTDNPQPEQFYRLGIGNRLAAYLRQIWPHQVEEIEWPPPGILPPRPNGHRRGRPNRTDGRLKWSQYPSIRIPSVSPCNVQRIRTPPTTIAAGRARTSGSSRGSWS